MSYLPLTFLIFWNLWAGADTWVLFYLFWMLAWKKGTSFILYMDLKATRLLSSAYHCTWEIINIFFINILTCRTKCEASTFSHGASTFNLLACSCPKGHMNMTYACCVALHTTAEHLARSRRRTGRILRKTCWKNPKTYISCNVHTVSSSVDSVRGFADHFAAFLHPSTNLLSALSK